MAFPVMTAWGIAVVNACSNARKIAELILVATAFTGQRIQLRKSKNKVGGLPTEEDFDPYQGDLDAQCAWRNFGGLTREQAYERFCENPLYYQEDFMFMGRNAFVYYFPVIREYLQRVEPEDEEDDCGAWILGCGVETQLDEHLSTLESSFVDEIRQLCGTVSERFASLPLSLNSKQQVLMQWQKVLEALGPKNPNHDATGRNE